MVLGLSLAMYFSTKLYFHILFSSMHHVHICHRKDYDEQKAVVVVKHHYQGYK